MLIGGLEWSLLLKYINEDKIPMVNFQSSFFLIFI